MKEYQNTKLEYIFESFTTPIDVIYKSDEVLPWGFAKIGKFNIGNKEFQLIIEKNQDERLMLVNFFRVEGTKLKDDDIGDLKKSEVLAVFSTILKEAQKYSVDSNAIILQSSTPRKRDVYWNITRRFKEFERSFTMDNTIVLNRKSQETLQIDKLEAQVKKMKYFGKKK